MRKSLRLRGILALLSMVLFLAIPTHPLGEETARGTDEIDSAQVQRIHETFKIYSVLMSSWTDPSEALAWSLARIILQESKRHSFDPALILAMINVESNFRDRAVSQKGALGLMQIRPFVGAALAQGAGVQNWQGEKSLFDPALNIKMGVSYLGQLKKRFRDLKLALAAYNLGPTDVRQMLNEGETVPLSYPAKVLAVHDAYRKHNPQIAVIALPVSPHKRARNI
ncbi:MAG: lytic transglycosylase domain-containing protein [Deltaproteobacteria bacterium]|nr:lytic transglycosylase domain-containing protein [Deltaproteobacteria bacterium]